MKKLFVPLREKIDKKLITFTDTPLIIYCAVILGLSATFIIRRYNEDLALNLFSELLGGAFTLFIINVLLVKNKNKRWLVVQDHVDYLIARHVNRLRDGLATRVFSFRPHVKTELSEDVILAEIRNQRDALFYQLVNTEDISSRISKDLFSEDNYDYFNEKADDIWNLLNMKYSEYLNPQLVSLLIELHTQLKDICAHIRLYKKADLFVDEKAYYQASGMKGAAAHLKEVIVIVNRLKQEGYSEPARKI
ncbi:hypothetical protein RCC89_07180 [Cytophagaceae bacterium ABcell3]|nr:hypothetical protein RCC89_07180 [Cytophagaceae bacterium ABcell3]